MMTDIMRYKKIGDYYTKFAASLGKSVGALTGKQRADALSTYAAGGAVELKPCPFCKSTLLLSTGESGKVIMCLDCESSSPIWNTRRAQWVAVSEKMPKKGECVIVEVENHTPDGGKWCEIVRWFDLTSLEVILCGEIINWLPLDWLPRPETADK